MLSKSNFRSYLECPCLLWLEKVRPDLLPDDFGADFQAILDEGNRVDAEAKKLYPGGLEISGQITRGGKVAYNMKESAKATTAALKGKNPVLFQPTAQFQDFQARADILTKNGANWDIREVKGSLSAKDEHFIDLAFQRMCFEGAGVPIGKTYLVHLNGNYVRRGPINPTKLFKTEDVTAAVNRAAVEMRRDLRGALEVLEWGMKPTQENVDACTNPVTCEYLGYYLDELPAEDRDGLREMRDKKLPVPPIVFIDKAGIRKRLAALEYPLQYLDYETYSPFIPLFDGYRPHQRVVFQYSLDVQEKPGGPLRHAEYLETKVQDPTEPLSAHLRDAASKGGTWLAWNKSFEATCNNEMAYRAPEFAAFYHDLNTRLFDPGQAFFHPTRGHYSHSDMRRSWSLKKVLPVLFPKLAHANLNIQDGMTASMSWPILTNPETPAADRKKLKADMLEYCGVDTVSMAAILGHLREVSEE